jgi:ATP-dependent helicase/nuclease subunit B
VQPFLEILASYIHQNHHSETGEICVILPNKRGALYLKNYLASKFNRTIWIPTIFSAEEFISEISGFNPLDSVDAICELYNSYKEVLKDKAEPFESFVKWGNIMLQDFNEADRYLVDTDILYSDLRNIKEIENWSLSKDDLTFTQKEYIEFMHLMGEVYKIFSKKLIEKKIAYQGLMYREAVKKIANSNFPNKYSKILICGFNALNKSEIIIFSELVKQNKATILWDTDAYYIEDEIHEAGLFLRKNFTLTYLNNSLPLGNYYKEIDKKIDIVAVPKQIGQVQVAAQQLSKWVLEGKSIHKTAVVLADETLLFPLINILPEEIKHVNITMEYPLRLSPIYDLIEHTISLHAFSQKNNERSFYFSEIFKIIQNSLFIKYYSLFSSVKELNQIVQTIIEKNYVWLNQSVLAGLFGNTFSHVECFFKSWKNSKDGIESLRHFLNIINQTENDKLSFTGVEKEYIFVFNRSFNRLASLIVENEFLSSLQTLKSLYKQIIGTSSTPFIGEPLQGLQIMGVLETRTLDFENVIILGVNEGVLPSGKSVNSFIPNDLKRHNEMPLYTDKDAVYAYHFYRLLQRASNVLLTYNTEQDTFGNGEKSRFITQLQFELPKYNSKHLITEKMLSGDVLPPSQKSLIKIKKTELSLNPILKKLCTNDIYSGLSPSAIIMYKGCQLKFFFRYGVSLKETEEIEENAEANTQGTILHEALEELYKPFIGSVLSSNKLAESLPHVEKFVNKSFDKYFTQQESKFGKNYLQKQVLFEYVSRQIKQDIQLIDSAKNKNEYVSLIDLEKELQHSITVNYNGNPVTVFIKGTTDRVDRVGNKIRVIDYKSSISKKDKFKYDSFELLFDDSGYNKMLQLFIYAWLIVKNNIAKPEELLPCIIPFKQLEDEPNFIKTNDKKSTFFEFTHELINDFEQYLISHVEHILNSDIDFEQTNDDDICKYCAYKTICNV